MPASPDQRKTHPDALPLLALAALGVVFGDIGTSPLYTLSACLSVLSLPPTAANLLGMLSLIFWTLVLVVAVKYAGVVMRADQHGEGGVMVITALASRTALGSPRTRRWILILGLLGASLFYGDGVVTPAISVLSALGGLTVASSAFKTLIVPLSLGIIVALFLVQHRGTGAISRWFGPVMLVWFVLLLISGGFWVVRDPRVLAALSPVWALRFLIRQGLHGLAILGAVVLAVTGAEALYADLGHFGAPAIRSAWFVLVLPALALNYLGQGALLILHPAAAANPFFKLFPAWATLPMVAVSGIATIIASQSIISGAYSATRQASLLGYLPRLSIIHTSSSERGQIYLPGLNWLLMVAVVVVILVFRSSAALSFAYGTAVTGTMVFTTLMVYFVARYHWKWRLWKVGLFSGFFLLLDGVFFGANVFKFAAGGWFPVTIGLAAFTLMATWRRGHDLLARASSPQARSLSEFLAALPLPSITRVPGTAVFLTVRPQGVPHALLHNLKHNKVLHERVVILTIQFEDVPRIAPDARSTLEDHGQGVYRLTARYGFMEGVDVPGLLAAAPLGFPWNPMDTTYFVSRQRLVPTRAAPIALWRQRLYALMLRLSANAIDFFRLPASQTVELGDVIELPSQAQLAGGAQNPR